MTREQQESVLRQWLKERQELESLLASLGE